MERRADIAVRGPEGGLELVVEVKNRPGRSDEWAARTLRNLLVHGAIPEASYLMLVLPDAILLWDNHEGALLHDSGLENGGVRPSYRADSRVVLSDYLEGSDLEVEELSASGLEMLVASWLAEIIGSDLAEEASPPGMRWLFDSGLYGAIRSGTLLTEALV